MADTVGRIVFGPRTTEEDRRTYETLLDKFRSTDMPVSDFHVCNCVGPQYGEKLCPCALHAEMERGNQMVEHGVTINGVDYDLVPRGKSNA